MRRFAAVAVWLIAAGAWAQDLPPVQAPAEAPSAATANSGVAQTQAAAQTPTQSSVQSSASVSTPAPAPAVAAQPKTFTVPAGTKILLQMRNSLNTRSAKPGDGVYLASTFPVVVGNHVLIPPGVYVQGVVDRVQRAGRVSGKAQLDLHFTSMIFPNGTVVEIPGIVNSVPGAKKQDVKGDGEGTIEQDSDKTRNMGKVAEVAIPTGGTVGAISGIGSGHPLAGGLVGMGAGLAAAGVVALFTRGADVDIEAGSQVEMVFQRPLELEETNLNAAGGSATILTPSATQPQPLPKPHVLCPPGGLGCQ
jgi:hypothetical protein